MANSEDDVETTAPGSIVDAKWPRDLPHPQEAHFLSVSVGNTHLKWCYYTRDEKHEFEPGILWRTPALSQDDFETDRCGCISRFFSADVARKLFGYNNEQNRTSLLQTASKNRIPCTKLFVISTNSYNEKGLTYMFKDSPIRLLRIGPEDFISEAQGAYETMGVDRRAALLCALSVYGPPCMVVDAGTCLTWTACDGEGKVAGGGIAPGVQARFRSMSDYTGELPMIKPEEWSNTLRLAVETKEEDNKLKIFETDTEKQMVSSTLTECFSSVQRAVREFVTKFPGPNKEDQPPAVVLTGGDGEFIRGMLTDNYAAHIAGLSDIKLPEDGKGVRYAYRKHMIPFAIVDVLRAAREAHAKSLNSEDAEIRNKLVGLRVAKEFPENPDEDGDSIYRGTVVYVEAGRTLDHDLYRVHFDDGDVEDLAMVELYDALKLYASANEKPAIRDEAHNDRASQSMEGTKVLETTSLKVKQKLAQELEAEKQREEEEKKRKREEARQQEEQRKKQRIEQERLADEQERQRRVEEDQRRQHEERRREEERQMAVEVGTQPENSISEAPQVSEMEVSSTEHVDDSRSPITVDGPPESYVGKRVAKFFDNAPFYGTVRSVATEDGEPLWHIRYDDSDEEDYDVGDLELGLKTFASLPEE